MDMDGLGRRRLLTMSVVTGLVGGLFATGTAPVHADPRPEGPGVPPDGARLADRVAIDDLIVAYSYAIDDHAWDRLDDIFTADAVVDYTATGGIRGHLPEIKAFLASSMPAFDHHAHMVGKSQVEIHGTRATARTFCFNPLPLRKPLGQVYLVGLWYDDDLVFTGGRWRIRRRVQRKSFDKLV